MTDVLEQTPPEPARRARRPAPRHARRRVPGLDRQGRGPSELGLDRGLDHVRDRRGVGRLHARPAAPQPAVLEHHSHGRRHGGACLGPCLPARPHPPALAAVGMGARLVRRLPDVPVLHGHPRAGRGAGEHPAALRARSEARLDLRRALAPDRSVGVRQAERPSLPTAGDVLGDVGDLPLRRELHDLRRQHRIDDGGRVLVLDRAVARVRLLRSARPRAAHGKAPCARGRAVGAVRALPPDRGDLRGDGHRRVVPALPRPAPLQVARRRWCQWARCSLRSGSCRSSCAATTSPTWGTNGAPTT